jgi:SAM-dependent methyltransferase
MSGSRPNHNIPIGNIKTCQICGSTNLEPVLDLGHQPLCDTLLSAEDLTKPELTYPLKQVWCHDCTLSQLDYCVPGDVVYHKEYPYRTGITRELAEYQGQLATNIIADLQVDADQLVVDIGCNDGTLLQAFRKNGMRVMGVEPTLIAQYAREVGIDTLQTSFNVEAAKQIVDTHGPARVATATNVFAHMAGLGDFMLGLEALVAKDGFFVLENHYLEAVMQRMQFDTIYHEHLRTYSLTSLLRLFDYYDFSVVDACRVSRYGGNIRVYAARGKNKPCSSRVHEIVASENQWIRDPDYYRRFRDQSIRLKNQLLELALECERAGSKLIGNSCPGRSSTLLNFAGIGPDLMPYIAEQPTSLKLGKFLPGRHIPIVNNQRLIDEQPGNVLLLAWHYAQPIAEQLRARGLRSKLFTPMPTVSQLPI